MKIKAKLEKIQRATPRRSKHGQLYRVLKDTRGAWNSVTLFTLFRSDENTHLLRPHVFKSKAELRTAAQWAAWFGASVALNPNDVESPQVARLTHIHARFVLPGLAVRTQKRWQVEKIIGWVPNAIHKSEPAAVGERRNKAKSKGESHG